MKMRTSRHALPRTTFCLLLLLAFFSARQLGAIDLKQLAGAAHAYPVMLDLEGKEIGSGEFTQSVDGGLLQIEIRYELKGDVTIEEKASFRQRPELSEKEWSWRESKGETLQRDYKVDFETGKAVARKREGSELKEYAEQLKIEKGRTFAGFGFTLALENLRESLIEGAELQAVGFNPKPRIVSVKITYAGAERLAMSGRGLRAEHFLIHPEIPAIAKLFVKIPDTHSG